MKNVHDEVWDVVYDAACLAVCKTDVMKSVVCFSFSTRVMVWVKTTVGVSLVERLRRDE